MCWPGASTWHYHKMLSDLLHVFIVEEVVEAQLVCSEKESETKMYCVVTLVK